MGSMQQQVRRGFSARARFVVGRDNHGWWVVSDRKGLVGGLFTNEAAAIHFAVEASDRHPEDVCRAPDGAAIDLGAFASRPTSRRTHS
ncbi:hypothetical protein BLJAPNOD_01188 [Ensifer sp. M14]|uniref:hypothetical protein n=1 Tax=Ensifer sp. M14 TaxID=2203782 RepID=UPI000E1CA71F|nr:hypothetical protein [Ensifer sp. M14]RDL50073.1 hypothetical protein BLJAPNOD_01188 [Ensifer sp. M14]